MTCPTCNAPMQIVNQVRHGYRGYIYFRCQNRACAYKYKLLGRLLREETFAKTFGPQRTNP